MNANSNNSILSSHFSSCSILSINTNKFRRCKSWLGEWNLLIRFLSSTFTLKILSLFFSISLQGSSVIGLKIVYELPTSSCTFPFFGVLEWNLAVNNPPHSLQHNKSSERIFPFTSIKSWPIFLGSHVDSLITIAQTPPSTSPSTSKPNIAASVPIFYIAWITLCCQQQTSKCLPFFLLPPIHKLRNLPVHASLLFRKP